MAFKSVNEYNANRFQGLFLLRNDGDYADVVFLYPNSDAVLLGDMHYIKSVDYTGYVHCCGRGCPACAKNIRVQTKLFIPLYNIAENQIQFWDRSARFESQLLHDVFQKCPNPSEFVFRIIRHGAAGDVNTTYEIRVLSKTPKSYVQILSEHSAVFPDYYEHVAKEYSIPELNNVLNVPEQSNSVYSADLPDYQVTPRTSYTGTPYTGTPYSSTSASVPSSDAAVPAEESFADFSAIDLDDSSEELEDPVDF